MVQLGYLDLHFLYMYSNQQVSVLFHFQFYENGFAVIENFLSKDEADELKLAGLDLCKNAPERDRKIFNTRDNLRLLDDYFLESANKIHYFYEKGALDNNGNFLTDKIYSLNKVFQLNH